MTDTKTLDEIVRRSEERHHKVEVSIQGEDLMGETPDPVDMGDQLEAAEPPVASGYTIGVKEDGKLFFQIHGEKKGSIELLGLNALAFKQIQTLVDANLNQGNPQLVQGMNALFQKLLEIEQHLSQAEGPSNDLKLS